MQKKEINAKKEQNAKEMTHYEAEVHLNPSSPHTNLISHNVTSVAHRKHVNHNCHVFLYVQFGNLWLECDKKINFLRT